MSPFPNLSEIVTTAIRQAAVAVSLQSLLWEPQKPGTVSLPDFIRLSAEGEAKMQAGIVYLKADE